MISYFCSYLPNALIYPFISGYLRINDMDKVSAVNLGQDVIDLLHDLGNAIQFKYIVSDWGEVWKKGISWHQSKLVNGWTTEPFLLCQRLTMEVHDTFISSYDNHYPMLNIKQHYGLPTEEHLEALTHLQNLPHFYHPILVSRAMLQYTSEPPTWLSDLMSCEYNRKLILRNYHANNCISGTN